MIFTIAAFVTGGVIGGTLVACFASNHNGCDPGMVEAARATWRLRAWAKAYDTAMDDAERPPTGDDYNELYAQIGA